MAQFKFVFRIETAADESKVIRVKSIVRSSRGNAVGEHHAFPRSLQDAALHKELMGKTTIEKNLRGITKYRSIAVTLADSEARRYTDEEGNFEFQGVALDECEDPIDAVRKAPVQPANNYGYLLSKIRELEAKLGEQEEKTLKNAREKFAIREFDGTTAGAEYLTKFEAECERYEIESDTDKIEILRTFCTGRAATWYETSERMLNRSWTSWSDSFRCAFKPAGWAAVRAAYGLRLETGESLIDYALEKQNRFAEIDPTIHRRTLIDAIVAGLPRTIQLKLDRDDLNSIEKLHEILCRLNDPIEKDASYNNIIP